MISERVKRVFSAVFLALIVLLLAAPVFASEADLVIPPLTAAQNNLLMVGFVICFLGMAYGYFMYAKVKGLPAHKSMLDVAQVILKLAAPTSSSRASSCSSCSSSSVPVSSTTSASCSIWG